MKVVSTKANAMLVAVNKRIITTVNESNWANLARVIYTFDNVIFMT